MPNASRPAASLSPPRPTYACSGSVISIGAPAGMGWQARLATRPATVTTPARMRLWARARLSTSLRRTMARSNRSATTESFPGSVFDVAVVLASFRELLKVKRSGTLLAVLILDEDLHLALGFLKHFETDLGELDALLEDPHGVFKRQFAALQFGDDRFQPGQRFFEFDRGHSSAPSTAHYTPPGFRINSLAVFWTSHNSSPAASRTCTTSPGATAEAARKTVSSGHRRVMLNPRPRIARGLKAWSVPMDSSKARSHNSSITLIRCCSRVRKWGSRVKPRSIRWRGLRSSTSSRRASSADRWPFRRFTCARRRRISSSSR